jgi:hypothetical protein
LLAASAVALAVAIGFAVASWSPSNHSLLLVALAGLLAAPVVSSLVKRSFDPFEPMAWAIACLATMFVIRPVSLIVFDELVYRERFALERTFDLALLGALVGVITLYLGYYSPLGRAFARRLPAPPSRSSTEGVVAISALLVALGLAGYAVFVAQAGVSAVTGVQADPTASTAYLYLAPFLIIPAGLALVKTGLDRRAGGLVVIGILLAGLLALQLTPQGGRLWLLVLLASFGVYALLRPNWRPRLWLVFALLVPTLFLIVSMRELEAENGFRGFVEALETTWQSPADSARELVTGPDTEMFDALAVEMQVVPSQLDHSPGSALAALITHPVPRRLWPDKPFPSDSMLNEYLWDVEATDASVAYSLLGGFYFDAGLLGIGIGMVIVGVGLRTLWTWFLLNRANDWVTVTYAAALPFVVVLLRGNLPDTFSRVLFVVVPLLVIAKLAGYTRRRLSAAETSRLRPV